MDKIKEITGKFVLYSLDGEFTFDENRDIVFVTEGVPLIKNPYPTYFESGFDDNKARYWTKQLKDAHVFTSLDEATQMLVKTYRICAPVFIRSIE